MANIWSMAHNGARSDQQHMTKVWLIWASLCSIFDQHPTNRPTNPPTKPRGPGGGWATNPLAARLFSTEPFPSPCNFFPILGPPKNNFGKGFIKIWAGLRPAHIFCAYGFFCLGFFSFQTKSLRIKVWIQGQETPKSFETLRSSRVGFWNPKVKSFRV